MNVLHTALWVSDVESMKSFYQDGLDLKHARDFVGGDDATNHFIPGDSDTEIQFKFYEDDAQEVPSTFDHLGIEVANVHETIETLTDEFGSKVVRGPKTLKDKTFELCS